MSFIERSVAGRGEEILTAIVNRMLDLEKLPKTSKTITTVEELMEVTSMLEANTKKWEASVLERGIEQGKEQGKIEDAEKMVELGISDIDIRKITGLSLAKTEQIRKKLKKK